MKLHWFSPLPPARTGIAAYTAELLPFLTARIEVVLWTDQEVWDRELERHAEVRRYAMDSPDPSGIGTDDCVVYQMGNSAPFHASLWRMSRRRPGLVVLHDLHLHHFFRGFYGDRRDDAGYVRLMHRTYGPDGRWAATEACRGRRDLKWMSAHFPLFEPAVNGALGVVTHTAKAHRALKRWGHCPVLPSFLPYPIRIRQNTPRDGADGPHRLAMFGHIGENRCLPDLIKALASFPRRDRFQLDVYGEVAEPAPVKGLIRRHALEGRVRLHGHAAEAVLDAGLAAGELAVNLRYPTMGEGSHSQLRIWEHALPSLVMRTGWYACLPDDMVVKLRPGRLEEDLHNALAALVLDPGRFRRMGLRGREWLLARHDPRRYAHDLLEFARRLRGSRRAWASCQERADRVLDFWDGSDVRRRLGATVRERVVGLAGPAGG